VRGYFEIGVWHPKTEVNVGTLWRSAYQLGAVGIFVVGLRYRHQASDTYRTNRHLPLREHDTFEQWQAQRPHGARLVAIETSGRPLARYIHPARAVYLLGAEDTGLPRAVLDKCQDVVSIESVREPCFNVAVAGAVAMYHRLLQKELK
jgi:tRNA(Leu) C34 or U34 (ribose-2'-O)-methylase TrmL